MGGRASCCQKGQGSSAIEPKRYSGKYHAQMDRRNSDAGLILAQQNFYEEHNNYWGNLEQPAVPPSPPAVNVFLLNRPAESSRQTPESSGAPADSTFDPLKYPVPTGNMSVGASPPVDEEQRKKDPPLDRDDTAATMDGV